MMKIKIINLTRAQFKVLPDVDQSITELLDTLVPLDVLKDNVPECSIGFRSDDNGVQSMVPILSSSRDCLQAFHHKRAMWVPLPGL